MLTRDQQLPLVTDLEPADLIEDTLNQQDA